MGDRPFPDAQSMDAALISAWNARVTGNDTVWKHAMRSFMIHGHIHNDTRADFWPLLVARDNVPNAGVDINGYMPVTFDEMQENNRIFKNRFPERTTD